ncbi:uncharacterized protein [Montipora capricornis]|uniref:uncharacterized protein n=1 Tax=Montipora capricornis TaxID=246305 RepID=UPI0035F125BD
MSKLLFDKLTEKLQDEYKIALLHITNKLDSDEKETLRFYYSRHIPQNATGWLNVMHSLENTSIISWIDVRSLQDSLKAIRRLDLAETLSVFEIKRDLAILLDLYAREILGMETSGRFPTAQLVAGYLVKVTTELVNGPFKRQKLTSLMESTKKIEKVLISFEMELNSKSWDPWSKFTFLVIITGEIVARVATKEELCRKLCATELCLRGADELCSRMMKLKGKWEDFCNYVEERHNVVNHNCSAIDSTNFSTHRLTAEVVQQLEETKFFNTSMAIKEQNIQIQN